jgi:hypothetical protein
MEPDGSKGKGTAIIVFGVCHLNVSNGKGFEACKNPSYDGNGGYIGVIYRF